jgi:Asp-tRNA(Asn)/Glu-tRNA(Gln) amidotransferase A subunit family amidase
MPNRLTIAEMSKLIHGRKLSALELVDAHLAQIEKHNPKLNAFVSVFIDEAREAAKNADEQSPNGKLHGIPVTIKDSLDVAGYPTRCGSRFNTADLASQDSAVTRRLRNAGAIVLGKTNCPEFLMNYETDNFITGRTNNPWDLDRTPGGSSGGESAAISSFCSAGGIGSDGGGSIRIPAHFCGIAGLKPTPGRISAAGHLPKIAHPGGLLGVVGPMARTARDLKLMFDVLAGYDIDDPFSASMPIQEPDLSQLRIGVMEQFYGVPVQDAMKTAVRKASAALAELKIPVDPFTPKGLERAPNAWWFFFGELSAPFIRDTIAGREQEAHWTGTEFVNTVAVEPVLTAKQVVEQLAVRDSMRAALLRQMEQYRVLLLPACGVPAFYHRERRWPTSGKEIRLFEAMMPVTPWNILSLPAVVIPFDLTPEGLPVGIQLVGRPFEEEVLLEIAMRLEDVRGPFPSPLGF